jgi:hypothetical protein
MTLAEICEQYKGKWVLIEYHELDRNLEVVEGDVIAEAPTKDARRAAGDVGCHRGLEPSLRNLRNQRPPFPGGNTIVL